MIICCPSEIEHGGAFMKRFVSYLLIAVFVLSGCGKTNSETESSVYYTQYNNVGNDIVITVVNKPVFAKTETIELEFTNLTDHEVYYSETYIRLEKTNENGYYFIRNYGSQQDTSTILRADKVGKLSVNVEPLEPGTYRLVFLQGNPQTDGLVYISEEFEVYDE